MKPKTKDLIMTVALAAVLSLVAALPCAAQLPATDLGVLGGRAISHATAMNSSGQIVGYCVDLGGPDDDEQASTWLPFVWQNGTMTPLPLLPGSTAGAPWDINSSGQIVGVCLMTASEGLQAQACLWTPTGKGWRVTGLGIPAGCMASEVKFINDAGQMVVQCEIDKWPWLVDYFRDSHGGMTLLQDADGFPLGVWQINAAGQVLAQGGPPSWGAVLWDAGAATDLVPEMYGVWMNDLGQVVGSFGDSSSGTTVETDFIYLPEAAYGLPAGLSTWPVSTEGGYFGGINNAGQVLLIPRPAADGAGYFTTDVKVIQLGGSVSYQVTVPGYTSFYRVAINGKGQVAGDFSTANDGGSGFYADPGTGLTLLEGLGGLYWRAIGLNDYGMIFGDSALADGTAHACMWMAPETYSWSGVLQPINSDGTSVSKAGSTVPVKFKLTGGSAGITDLKATLSYALISNAVVGSINEAVSTSAATTGNLFRYDPSARQYIFNWSTKGLARGTYRLFINLGDGVEHTVDVGLR